MIYTIHLHAHLVVVRDVADEAAESVWVGVAVPHRPVEVDLDTPS